MSSTYFDQLLRTLAASPSRRAALRALGALAVGLVAVPATDGAAEMCDPCRKKRRGKCRGARKDGTTCAGAGFCVQGICHFCVGPQTLCLDNSQCRSNVCKFAPGAEAGLCSPGAAGSLCHTNADCASNNCVQFACQ